MTATRSQRLTYAAAQTARVAFYGAHYLAARVLARDAFSTMEKLPHGIPSLRAMGKAMAALFARDWENVQAGLYPMPVDIGESLKRASNSLRYLTDVPRVVKRQKEHGHSDVPEGEADLPRYFRQNFHYQTGGYLSAESAKLYDFQVEALFAGTADAMRRRAFVPLAKHFDSRKRKAPPKILDVGAGTGTFLAFVHGARPAWKLSALDLSKPYLARAKKRLGDAVEYIAAPAEKMPLKDASVDAAVSIYLFHELPPKIRTAAAKEIARVLKPGGIFVLADTIQYGDVDGFDGLLDAFPQLLHEPYYSTYAKTDLEKLFGAAGLMRIDMDIAYLTKVAVFAKPGARRTAHRA